MIPSILLEKIPLKNIIKDLQYFDHKNAALVILIGQAEYH